MSRSSSNLAKTGENQQLVQQLVDELMKDQPNDALVRKLSRQLGISYSADSVTQINSVLQSLHSVYLTSTTKIKPLEG